MSIILSLDVSCGASKIRRAINDVAGVEDVEVFDDTDRIVVTGWADVTELVTRLESRLRRQVDIISSQHPRLQFSSDDSSEEEEECYGMDLPAPRVREPQWFDNPVPDPAPWFLNFTLADSTPRRDDGAGPSGT